MDKFWLDARDCLGAEANEIVVGPAAFPLLAGKLVPYGELTQNAPAPSATDRVIIHKGEIGSIPARWLAAAIAGMEPIFANEVFVVYGKKQQPCSGVAQSDHFQSFLGFLEAEPPADEIPLPKAHDDTVGVERKLAFMHFFKAGGTSAHMAMASGLPPGETCQIRADITMPETTVAGNILKLAPHRFVSGHFNIALARRLRDEFHFALVTQFREPTARVASAYNFLRAHSQERHPFFQSSRPSDRYFAELIIAAQSMPPREFFASPVCMGSPFFNNHYLQCLSNARSPAGEMMTFDDRLSEAIENLGMFSAIGSIDAVEEMVNVARRWMRLPELTEIARYKVTKDEMAGHEWLQPVDYLYKADDISEFIAPLVEFDVAIHSKASEIRSDCDFRGFSVT